jgi:hypothetical protein
MKVICRFFLFTLLFLSKTHAAFSIPIDDFDVEQQGISHTNGVEVKNTIKDKNIFGGKRMISFFLINGSGAEVDISGGALLVSAEEDSTTHATLAWDMPRKYRDSKLKANSVKFLVEDFNISEKDGVLYVPNVSVIVSGIKKGKKGIYSLLSSGYSISKDVGHKVFSVTFKEPTEISQIRQVELSIGLERNNFKIGCLELYTGGRAHCK